MPPDALGHRCAPSSARRGAALDAAVVARDAAPAPRASGRGRTARTARPSMPASASRVDADGRRQHGHVAGQRLEHGQAEALALGGHEHGVGGVDPQRHARRARRRRASAARRRPPRELAPRSWRFSGATGSAGNSRNGAAGSSPSSARASRAGQRAEALECRRRRAAPARARAPRAAAARGERRRDGREEVDQGRDRARGQARAGVAQVGAVHRQRADPRRHRERGPGGQAEVGVDDVEALRPRRSGGAARAPRRASARGPGRELVQLDLQSVEARSASTWSRTKLPALGVGAVGQHVGDHERAHDPPTVALWNDGPRAGPDSSQRSYGRAAGELRPPRSSRASCAPRPARR